MNEFDDYEIWKNVTKSIKTYSNNKISHKARESLIVKKKRSKTPNSIAKNISVTIFDKTTQRIPTNKNSLTVDLRNLDNNKTGIDRNTLKRIKKGIYQIDDTLDLHGTKLIEAELSVKSFIKQAFMKQQRFLLIITGKGLEGKGQIRKNISSWLNDLDFSKMILAFSSADKKDGGEGAIYVKLRRNKNINI